MEKEQKLTIIGVLIITIVFLVSAIIIIIPLLEEEEKTSESKLTTSYTGINATKAYEIITNNENVNIIDNPDGCHCRYDTEHIGDPPDFEATLVKDIKTFYNTTNITISGRLESKSPNAE